LPKLLGILDVLARCYVAMSNQNYIPHDAGYYSSVNDHGGAAAATFIDSDSAIGDTDSFRSVTLIGELR
jgi:hypothetical protein